MWETWVQSLGWEDPLEKGMATHSSTLAWRIPWMEEPGGLQSTGLQRVRHDWATSLSLSLSMLLRGFPGGSDGKESACNAGGLGSIPELGRSPGGGHGNPLQFSCLENPHGQRSLVGCSPWGHKESNTTERLSTACILYPRLCQALETNFNMFSWTMGEIAFLKSINIQFCWILRH